MFKQTRLIAKYTVESKRRGVRNILPKHGCKCCKYWDITYKIYLYITCNNFSRYNQCLHKHKKKAKIQWTEMIESL